MKMEMKDQTFVLIVNEPSIVGRQEIDLVNSIRNVWLNLDLELG